MKTLEFIYQETQIHFLINPTDENVMVNATEMAKLFNKDVRIFLKADHVKKFIETLLMTPNGINKAPLTIDEIIKTNKKAGTYMHRLLALKFAAWLDTTFEVWVYSTIERITFGYLKDYKDAMLEELEAKNKKENLKNELLASPTLQTAKAYFDNEAALNSAKAKKRKATTNQLNLFQVQKNPQL